MSRGGYKGRERNADRAIRRARNEQKIDVLYISRPQVERWPVELLKRYINLRAAREELKRREVKQELEAKTEA